MYDDLLMKNHCIQPRPLAAIFTPAILFFLSNWINMSHKVILRVLDVYMYGKRETGR